MGSDNLEIKVMIYGLIGLDLHHVVAVAIPRKLGLNTEKRMDKRACWRGGLDNAPNVDVGA